MSKSIFIKRFYVTLFVLLVTAFYQNSFAQQPTTKVTLGIKPDYMHSLSKGITIGDVLPGKTAQKAGMLPNDVIIGIDKNVVKDIFDYKKLLDTYLPGQAAKVTIVRDKKTLIFDIKF